LIGLAASLEALAATMGDLRDELRKQLEAALQRAGTPWQKAAIQSAREQGFAEGYAAAIKDLTAFSGPLQGAENPSPISGQFDQFAGRPPRGTSRKLVRDVLISIAPRAIGPTEIVRLLKESTGVEWPYSSIRHALRYLEERGEIEEEGADTKRWRMKEAGK
jgi:hypothetical protein